MAFSGVPAFNLGEVPLVVLQDVADILDLKPRIGSSGATRLAGVLGYSGEETWQLMGEHWAMKLIRQCHEDGITLDKIQAALLHINSRAADVFTRNMPYIVEYVLRPRVPAVSHRQNGDPQQHSYYSDPGITVPKTPVTCPRCCGLRGCHSAKGCVCGPSTPYEHERHGACRHCVRGGGNGCHGGPLGHGPYGPQSDPRPQSLQPQDSNNNPCSPVFQPQTPHPVMALPKVEGQTVDQSRLHHPGYQGEENNRVRQHNIGQNGQYRAIGCRPIDGPNGANDGLKSGSMDFLESTGCQATFSNMSSDEECSESEQDDVDPDWSDRERKEIGPDWSARERKEIGPDWPTRDLPRANKRMKTEVPLSRCPNSTSGRQQRPFVFVTGGRCMDEMAEIEKRLARLEKLGFPVKWDRGLSDSGEEWRSAFKKARCVVIGLTRDYVDAASRRTNGGSNRASRINQCVQEERIRLGKNKRFFSVIMKAKHLNRNIPPDLAVGSFVWPHDEELFISQLKEKMHPQRKAGHSRNDFTAGH